MWMMLCKFINQMAGNQNTEAVNLNFNMWLSDDFYKEEGNFTQFSAVFNNQEIFPRA